MASSEVPAQEAEGPYRIEHTQFEGRDVSILTGPGYPPEQLSCAEVDENTALFRMNEAHERAFQLGAKSKESQVRGLVEALEKSQQYLENYYRESGAVNVGAQIEGNKKVLAAHEGTKCENSKDT